jgi:hypothetical protein
MLQLKYTKQIDKFQTVTVLGDPEGIRDLYWQLTKNYVCGDGTCIGDIRVLNLSGKDVTDTVTHTPWNSATRLSNLEP